MPPQSKKKRKIDEFGVPENVPAFLRKTWAILYTPAYSDIVYWGSNGTTIVIDKVSAPMYDEHETLRHEIADLEDGGGKRALKGVRHSSHFMLVWMLIASWN